MTAPSGTSPARFLQGQFEAPWPWVKTMLHSVFDQPNAASEQAQYDRLVDAVADTLPTVAEHLDTARPGVLASTCFPRELWRHIWSSNPKKRLNREIRRLTDGVGIFPQDAPAYVDGHDPPLRAEWSIRSPLILITLQFRLGQGRSSATIAIDQLLLVTATTCCLRISRQATAVAAPATSTGREAHC